MITNLSVRNFKCIDNTNIIFRPITILCGPNSSGKSSLIQSMLLLKQSVALVKGIHTLAPRGPIVDLGSFNDMVRCHNNSNRIAFEFNIQSPSMALEHHFNMIEKFSRNIWYRRMSHAINSMRYCFEYSYSKEKEAISLYNFSVSDSTSWALSSKHNTDGTYGFVRGRKEQNKKRKQTNPGLKSLSEFFSPNPPRELILDESVSAYKREKLNTIKVFMTQLLEVVNAEIASINYLGPFRQMPNRFYMTGGAMPFDIGYRGETAIDYLSHKKTSGEEDVISFVRKWLMRFGYAANFDVETIKSFVKTVTLTNSSSKVTSSLVDVGFGISQLLPVLIAVYRHKRGIHLFEQPEIHLHPRSQGDLADLFAENIHQNKSYVIETHSEHFLNRFRLRIAENKLDPRVIAIYFIHQDKGGYHTKEVTIASDGSFTGFPDNFFDESYLETIKIMEANIAAAKAKNELA